MARRRALAWIATAALVGGLVAPRAASGGALAGRASLLASRGPQLRLLGTVEAGRQTLPNPGGNGEPFQTDTAVEPSIAVNPANPSQIVTAFQTGRDDAGGSLDNGVAASGDGGLTWRVSAMPDLTRASGNAAFSRASDPVLAWGTGADVYYASLAVDLTSTVGRSAILVSVSHDAGAHWSAPATVQDDQFAFGRPGTPFDELGINDKEWIVVDTSTGTGHHPGRVYVAWDRQAGLDVKYSDDGARTWNPPSPVVLPTPYPGPTLGAQPVVLPNGDLTVVWVTNLSPIAMQVATARGAGLAPTGAPLVFVPGLIGTDRASSVAGQPAPTLPSTAVDPSSGRIYVAFSDVRFRADFTNDVVIVSSGDEGESWSPPVRVNAGPLDDRVDHYSPSVAAGPRGGVRVMWRQQQESETGSPPSSASTWVASSTDRGQSWGPPVRVDTGRNDLRFAAFSERGAFQGDYDQMVTVGGTSYLVYCDAWAAGGERPPSPAGDTTVHHQRAMVSIVGPAPG